MSDTSPVSRANSPDREEEDDREVKDYTTVLEMVKAVRDQLTALVLDNTNIRAACDDLRRQCHSQGVAFGDLVSQTREDQEETRAYAREETGPRPSIRPELLDARGNLRARDIGITWQDGDTFLHGVRITGQKDDMEDNHRRPATAAPYPPCPEELENARRQPAMSTPYHQSHEHPPGGMSTPGFPRPVCIEMSDTPAHHFAGPRQEGRPAHRPAAPIQRFNSKSIGWPAWFRHFRAVADVQGWDKDQRALQMVSYLDEKAMNVAQELSDRELYDYDALVGLLSARFDPASRVSSCTQLQLLVPKAGRERLFLSYHASLYGGHLGRTRTLARLADRFYWSGMADDVKDFLSQCVACIKRKSPVGRHHPLGNIPTGHRWDRIAMDILDVCDPTPEGFRYILVIADYFSKWTEAFPMKNKCADTVADILVENIILRFGMPLVIHSDQGREFENGLMKSLCALLGCTKTRTAPYHPESDGMIERFNRTCLMMLSMFVNDRRDNWHELLPFIMHAYRTSVHESTGYSPFRLMMGEECSLPQDVSTTELRTQRENDVAPHPFATWVRDALEVAYDHVRSSLKKTASRRKRLYDTKAVNRKFPVGSWVLRYYPPAAQHKLGSPWVGPHQVVRQATGHTVGIQRDADKPIIFVHVDDLKLCPGPQEIAWTPRVSTAKSLCASTVAFRPGSDMGDVTPDPSVDVSAWGNASDLRQDSEIISDLDIPIDLTGHILSPFYQRKLMYQDCTFQSIAHLLCYRYAIINNQKTFATGIRKWSRVLVDFPVPKFKSTTETQQWLEILTDIYTYLCDTDEEIRSALVKTGPRPFTLFCRSPWGRDTQHPDTTP